MEGGHNKGSKTSSDEAESPEHVNEDAATGPFYECVFCKRGFSTAQALGGHMNIHRKDRARMRQNPTPVVSRKAEEEAICYGYHHHPYTGQTPYYPTVSESLRSYPSHFPASTSGARDTSVHRDGHYESARPRELSPFGEELQLRLGMHAEMGKTKEEEGELDLELRLGH